MASDAVREDLMDQLRDEQQKGGRRVRVPRPAVDKPPSETLPPALAGEGSEGGTGGGHGRRGDEPNAEGGDTVDAPRKRRRRRRKPTGDGADPAQPRTESGEG